MLQAQYIHPEARCKDSGVSESTSQVTFDQVRPRPARGQPAAGTGACCTPLHGILSGAHPRADSPPPPLTTFSNQVTGLWILLAGTVLAALLIFAVSQMALCGARKVTTTKVFRGSVNALQEAGRKVSGTLPAMPQPITAIGSSITRLGGSLARRGADDGGAGAGAGSRWDSGKSIKDDAEAAGTEVELGTVLANVHALSATAAGLEAQLRQLVAAQAAAADRAP